MARRPWGSGTIVQRGKDKYLIRWSLGTDPFTGKQMRRAETLHGVTKAEAQRVLNQRQAAKRRSSRITLGEVIDVTLPELQVNESTRERYRHALAMIPAGALAWPIADITVPIAGDLFNQLAQRHGAANVHKAHTAIMACWRQAYRNGWVGKDDTPFSGIRLPKVDRSAGKLFTDEQLRTLIAVADPGVETAWIMLHIETGARPGEIRHLRWSQVDLDGAFVHVTDEKHKGVRRPVAVTQEMVDVLADWQREQAEQPVVADPHLFSTAPDASTPWRREYVRDRWHRLRSRAGIDDTIRLYDIRHTVNSWLAGSGMPSHVRGLRAGNSAKVNEDVYTHMAEAENRAAAEFIRRQIT